MTVENEAALVFIPVGVVAVDFHDFGNEAPSGPPLQMHNDVYGVADVCLDRAIRQVDAALEDATGESSKALLCGGGMDGRKAARMSRVEELQEIEGFSSSYFTQDDSVRPVTKGGFE